MPERKILYVEDNQINALVMQHILKKKYHLDIAYTPDEAWNFVQAFPYRLILMDINLGVEDVDGEQLMKRMRETYPGREVTFFAVSALPPEEAPALLEAGFVHFFGKPVDGDALIEAIEAVW